MADAATIEIPDRALFKATEVCELLKVQPYVLRTWEAEFPELGIARTAGAPRVYRRGDVEQVMRIRHLLLVEGLTLAGARRKIDEDADVAAPVPVSQSVVERVLEPSARQRLASVKHGLRSLLDLLSAPAMPRGQQAEEPKEFQLAPPDTHRAPASARAQSAKAQPTKAPSAKAPPAKALSAEALSTKALSAKAPSAKAPLASGLTGSGEAPAAEASPSPRRKRST